ncbi:ammonium transporter [Rhodococcus sp. NPDC003382]|uniref:ammonium transporter n=1 Tax=unclassified Rhodococcus (in: high G+C Gram-positive bacteria) TaxID=192944 RepID=UPI0018CC82A8|nr:MULTISPECIES: ammonium transporter [unclassified Rhodococcus (in: high G+C Gram-positive bacteria)]MBH0118830.1 ammonium transporter [Rhodococcus sp. CX]MCK8675358.1 ammonium transporter [Rhodococcus sp. HM1]
MEEAIAAADTAWVLAAFTAVALMVPGLALFYGGMLGVKSALNMIMMVLGGFAVAGVVWVFFGPAAVLGDSVGGLGLIGNPFTDIGLGSLLEPSDGLPAALTAAFHLLFAGITVAIIAGGVADRMKFSAWMIFSGIWVVLVYFPVAHWVFAFDDEDAGTKGGWIANVLGAQDFAGGTAVHMNAGVAALALAIALGKRRGFPHVPRPHSLPLVVLGGGILMFGWFGFNGGSAGGANHTAGVVVLNTMIAAVAGLLGWLLVERIREKHATTLGAVSGMIAALVGITPAASLVSPLGALLIGFAAGAVCFLTVSLKFKLGYDDSLDVVAIHLMGGVVGTLLIAFVATAAAPAGVDGLFFGGGIDLLGRQILAMAAVFTYSFAVTWLIAKAIDKTIGLRVDKETEIMGIDVPVHGETAYVMDSFGASAPSKMRPEEFAADREVVVPTVK